MTLVSLVSLATLPVHRIPLRRDPKGRNQLEAPPKLSPGDDERRLPTPREGYLRSVDLERWRCLLRDGMASPADGWCLVQI